MTTRATTRWTFNPVNERAWSGAEVRVMLLGAEPNDDARYVGPRDMGDWFRAATPRDKYSGNRRFYTNNIAQLCGALARSDFSQPGSLNADHLDRLYRTGAVPQMLQSLRYADLKATGGGASAHADEVEDYVLNNLDEVLELWSPTGVFQPPTHTVVQGTHAHSIFMQYIRPELAKRGWGGLYLGMLHPSHQGSYEDARRGLADMRSEFRPFTTPAANRWDGRCWRPMT